MFKSEDFFIDIDDLELASSIGETTFKKLTNQNILIIGATSFVGMWMTEVVLYADTKYSLGIKLTLISRNREKTIERFGNHISSGKIVPIYKPLQEVNREELSDIQQVVNLATLTDSTSGDLQLLDNISMFHNFWNLLDIKKIENVLFTSSGAVYGKNQESLTFLNEVEASVNKTLSCGLLGPEIVGTTVDISNEIVSVNSISSLAHKPCSLAYFSTTSTVC